MDTNYLLNRLKKLADGNMLILVDDIKQSSEGAIICLAEYSTSKVVNDMVTHARGMLSISMARSIAEQVGIPPQTDNVAPVQRNYTVSIDAEETTTGISAQERSFSTQKLEGTRTIEGFNQPGHIFPVIANEKGLYGCVSVIEGAIDSAEIVGVQGAMVTVCDILDQDGMMGDASYALKLAQNLHLSVVYLSELLNYKLTSDGLLTSKNKLSMNIDGRPVQIRVYELFGRNYEVYFDESKVLEVNKEMLKTQWWLINNAYDSLHHLPNYQSSASRIVKQFGNNKHLVIHGDLEPTSYIYNHMIYELILHDLGNELDELTRELSGVTN